VSEYKCSYCNKVHTSLDNHYYKDTKHFDFENVKEDDYRNGYDLAYHRVLNKEDEITKLKQIIEKQKKCLSEISEGFYDDADHAKKCLEEIREMMK